MGYDLLQALHEGLGLLQDSRPRAVFHDRFHILFLVLFGNRYIRSSRLQLNLYDLSKAIFCGSERLIQDFSDVVFSEAST